MRNVCTEAGMSAIRAERDYVIHEDFMKVTFSFSSLVVIVFKQIPTERWHFLLILTFIVL